MVAIVSLLIVLALSITVTKVAAVALAHTGLSRESARFQARSAFTGVGFTTSESEKIVNHPVRRRIMMLLMILGNAGIVTAVSSLIVGLIRATETEVSLFPRIALLVAGVVVLWAVASSRWVDRRLGRVIGWALARWTDLDTRDYARLLRLGGDYAVAELLIEENDWLANRELGDLDLPEEGLLVLGIQRSDGSFKGAPTGSTSLEPNDVAIIYGREQVLRALDERRAGWVGEAAHRQLAREHERAVEREQSPGSE